MILMLKKPKVMEEDFKLLTLSTGSLLVKSALSRTKVHAVVVTPLLQLAQWKAIGLLSMELPLKVILHSNMLIAHLVMVTLDAAVVLCSMSLITSDTTIS